MKKEMDKIQFEYRYEVQELVNYPRPKGHGYGVVRV